VLFVGPIFLRNVLVADDPVLISSQGGINFYIGNNPSADGVSAVMPPPLGHNWRIEDITFKAEQALGTKLSPGQVSSYWYDRGLEWVKSHPGDFIKLYLRKLYLNFSNREISNNRSLPVFMRQVPLLRYDPLSFWIIFPFAVLGVVLALRSRSGVVLTVALVMSYVIVTSLFFYNSRFRLPLMPYYIIFAASAPFALIEELSRRRLRVVLLLALGVVVSIFTLAPVVNVSRAVSTQDLLSRGLMQINRGEYRKAVDTYRIALAYNPDYPTTNLNLGISFMRLGQTDSAFYYLNRERELHPDRARAYINLASLYLVNDQYGRALEEAEQALTLRPYDVTANMVLLRAAAQSPKISDSSLVSLVDHSARNTNNDLFVLNDAATTLLSRGLTERAKTILLLAVNAKPPPIETDNTAFDADFRNSPENFAKEKAKTYYQLGYLNGVQGYFADAVKYSRDAIALDSNLVEAYINLTSGLASLGETARADSVLAVAKRRFPDDTRIDRLREMLHGIR
jgi:tetratricopeptide (TPR) repeat protein